LVCEWDIALLIKFAEKVKLIAEKVNKSPNPDANLAARSTRRKSSIRSKID
jgi:hypothetical protein